MVRPTESKSYGNIKRTRLQDLLPLVLSLEKVGDLLGLETRCAFAEEHREDDGRRVAANMSIETLDRREAH